MNLIEGINDYIVMMGSIEATVKATAKPYLESYKEIIKRTADLCYSLKLDNDTYDISIFFEYLLWCGYLSINHELSFCEHDIVNNMACNGADIMRGKSICMSNAEMLKRLYIEIGYEAYLLGCYIPNSMNGERHHKLNVKRHHLDREETDENLKNKKLNVNILDNIQYFFFSRLIGNHAITLVNDDGCFKAFDPTNVDSIRIYPNLTGRWYGGRGHFPLRFSVALTDTLLDMDNVEELKKGIKRTESIYIPLYEIREKEEKIISYLEANKKLLEEFHEDIKDDIERVAYTLRR